MKIKYYIVLCIYLLLSCSSPEINKTSQDKHEGTEQMKAALTKFRNTLNPSLSPYLNKARSDAFMQTANTKTGGEKITLQVRSAYELLLAGETQASIDKLLEYKNLLANYDKKANKAIIEYIDRIIATGYIRKAEQDNCQNNHSSNSCILPFTEDAVHKLKSGSQSAIETIEATLEGNYDENMVWLLNIAYETLGQHPEGVPDKYKRKIDRTEKSRIPRFENVASNYGLDEFALSGGVVIDDLNNDHLPDIAVTSWSLKDPIKIFFNRGNGKFEQNINSNLDGINGGLNLIHTDYNNDGFLDLYVLRGGWLRQGPPNSLLRNNGDESFSDVSFELGLSSARPTQTAVWADFNNDGWVDLFIGNEATAGSAHTYEFYLNNEGKSFEEISQNIGLAFGSYVKGVASADFDNDGDQDIYISNLKGKNLLYENLLETGQLRFQNIAEAAGVSGPDQSFPCWFFDANNDGWEDIFVSGYSINLYNNFAAVWSNELNKGIIAGTTPRLYINNGDKTFRNATDEYGLNTQCFTMGAGYGELNNDGFLDFYLATGEPDFAALIPNRMFLNYGGSPLMK
jgi:hypothetical protein